MTEYTFIDDVSELAHTVDIFFEKPEFWRATVGNAPKYFVHIQNGPNHSFGLSKFCAFKDISVEEYISTYRYLTNGGNTQKHIAKTLGKKWIPRKNIKKEIQQQFDSWILDFHPNYNLTNASFITIEQKVKGTKDRKKPINPDELEKALQKQKEIGVIGERIAFEFEINRLFEAGIKNPENYLEHTSKINSAAGFDLASLAKKNNRFIEVKASLNDKMDFFITENELTTLEQLGDLAYIYLVHVTDFTKKTGNVFKTIKNPILKLKKSGKLKPVAYKAEFTK